MVCRVMHTFTFKQSHEQALTLLPALSASPSAYALESG